MSKKLLDPGRHKICNDIGYKIRSYNGFARCTSCDKSFDLKDVNGNRCPCCNKQLKFKMNGSK